LWRADPPQAVAVEFDAEFSQQGGDDPLRSAPHAPRFGQQAADGLPAVLGRL
jgi:hypothetical protein